MWPSHILPKMNIGRVLSTHNKKNEIPTSRVESCRSDLETARKDFKSNDETQTAVEKPVNVPRPRSMKKSREDRYNDDIASNADSVPAPSVIPILKEAPSESPTVPTAIDTLTAETPRSPVAAPVAPLTKIDSSLSDISQVKFLCKGSHSRIFKGLYKNQTIIIKVMADSSVRKQIAQMEFKLEKDMLSRISHPNVIKIIGCGEVSSQQHVSYKRPLMVLEALTGGTLSHHLNKHTQMMNANFAGVDGATFTHSKMPFTEAQILRIARQFADALHYLHEKFAPNCTLIHRDLKPDNLGFTEDGVLKIMDFGLSTTVKKNSEDGDIYELSGCTGSYRYMAPEVALNRSYNEKVDIYSFGIIIYEALTGVVPYPEDCKDTFYTKVIHGDERPSFVRDDFGHPITSLDASLLHSMTTGEVSPGYWLQRLKNFLELCWDPNYTVRPTSFMCLELFLEMEKTLDLYTKACQTARNLNACMNAAAAAAAGTSGGSAASSDPSGSTDSGRSSGRNSPVFRRKSSMLLSQGDYNWTRESINVGASNGSGTPSENGHHFNPAETAVALTGSNMGAGSNGSHSYPLAATTGGMPGISEAQSVATTQSSARSSPTHTNENETKSDSTASTCTEDNSIFRKSYQSFVKHFSARN